MFQARCFVDVDDIQKTGAEVIATKIYKDRIKEN